MKARCYNKNDGKYEKYGGRGITVCDEWLHDAKKFAEWAYENGFDETKHQSEQSLDRIDVNGNYCPSNCRFVDCIVQANNKTNTIYITYKGEKKPLQKWADELGIKESTIRYRLNNGWDIKDVLFKPLTKMKNTKKNITIEYNGTQMTYKELAEQFGIPPKNIRSRLYKGWSIERAVQTKLGDDKWHKKKG